MSRMAGSNVVCFMTSTTLPGGVVRKTDLMYSTWTSSGGAEEFVMLRLVLADFMAILRAARDEVTGAVVHCFTGTRDELAEYLELDCHIGITGWICDERRGTHMKAFMSDIPADRLMIETDSPYLKPRNLRPLVKSHRNEPRWLPWIAGTLAACRGETPDTLAMSTTATARRFFELPPAPVE